MAWYAAHLISYAEFLDGNQDRYVLYENVVLIEENSADVDKSFEVALQLAQEIGQTYPYNDPIADEKLTVDGRPAKWVFAGVRKLIKCSEITYTGDDRGPALVHGTEVTYSHMVVDSEDALLKLMNGEAVMVRYEE